MEAVRRDEERSDPAPTSMNSYEPQASDTTEAIDRLVFEGFRAMSPPERLELTRKACHAVERMSMAGLRLRYPNAKMASRGRQTGGGYATLRITWRACARDLSGG